MKPETIKTNERIFKITTFDDETFLCNVDVAKQYLQEENIKKLWHLWNFKFETYHKIHLKNM